MQAQIGKNFLITGSEGFIGRNPKALLAPYGHDTKTLYSAGSPDFMLSATDPKVMEIREDYAGIFHLSATTFSPQLRTIPWAVFMSMPKVT